MRSPAHTTVVANRLCRLRDLQTCVSSRDSLRSSASRSPTPRCAGGHPSRYGARRYEKEYTPLAPADLEREPPPRPPVRDAYLQSRLDRFFAEVAQFQPGQTRAMYEDRLLRLGDGILPPGPDACAANPPSPGTVAALSSGPHHAVLHPILPARVIHAIAAARALT